MVLNVYSLDKIQVLINQINLAFQTVLFGNIYGFIFIFLLIFLGMVAEIFKLLGSFRLKELTEKFTVFKIVQIAVLILAGYFSFYPIETKVIKLKSSNGNVEKIEVESQELSLPIGDVPVYTMPFFIGGVYSTFDWAFYDPDYGVLANVFGPYYAKYIENPMTIFADIDLLLASRNFSDILELTSNRTQESVLSSYAELNEKYALVGEKLFENVSTYNNATGHQFFIDAAISPQEHSTTKANDYHGYFGDFPAAFLMNGYAEVNIAYQAGYDADDFSEKVREDVLSFSDSKYAADEAVLDYVKTIVLPMKKSMVVLDSIQISVESNAGVSDAIKNEFVDLIEINREAMGDIIGSLEKTITSDLNNIVFVRGFVAEREKEAKEKEGKPKNALESIMSWTKYLWVSPIMMLTGMSLDKLGSVLISIFIYLFFLFTKISYILFFLARSVFTGMAIGTLFLVYLKVFFVRDLSVMLVPISKFLKYRFFELALMFSGVLGTILPYQIALNIDEIAVFGDSFKDTGILLASVSHFGLKLL